MGVFYFSRLFDGVTARENGLHNMGRVVNPAAWTGQIVTTL